MFKRQKVLALVPARKGSKGLPGKNLKLLFNKPLIAWSINTALKSKYVDDVVVSTDCNEISDISGQFGAEVPFIRPEHLCTDEAKSSDVVLHALEWLEKRNRIYDIIVLLEPTSPLREIDDIDGAIDLMEKENASSVVGVCAAEAFHPAFLFTVNEKFRLSPFSSSQSGSIRRQDLETIYYLEGTIYCSKTYSFKKKKSFYHEDTIGYVVPNGNL